MHAKKQVEKLYIIKKLSNGLYNVLRYKLLIMQKK